MTIPLYYLLIPWAIVIGITVLLSLVNLFHLVHYGFFTFRSALFCMLYYGAVAIVLFWTFQELSQFDWHQVLLTIGKPDLSLPKSF